MNLGHKIEWPKGGIMRDELTELQKQEMAGDPIFENAVINDEYVKKLKEKQSETIYVE